MNCNFGSVYLNKKMEKIFNSVFFTIHENIGFLTNVHYKSGFLLCKGKSSLISETEFTDFHLYVEPIVGDFILFNVSMIGRLLSR